MEWLIKLEKLQGDLVDITLSDGNALRAVPVYWDDGDDENDEMCFSVKVLSDSKNIYPKNAKLSLSEKDIIKVSLTIKQAA